MTTYTWTPPTVSDNPPVDEKQSGLPYRLYRWFGTRARGKNIWKLVDGTITDQQPFPLVSVVEAQRQSVDHAATYISVWYGGHLYSGISQADADAIQAAGFGVEGVTLIPDVTVAYLLTSDGRYLAADTGAPLVFA
jgi:hypothetical protein